MRAVHVAIVRRAIACLPSGLLVAVALSVCSPGIAIAEEGPRWLIDAAANTTAVPGSTLTYYAEFRDLSKIGTAPGFMITGSFPEGLRPTNAFGHNGFEPGECHVEARSITCEFAGARYPIDPSVAEMTVEVEPGARGRLVSRFEVAGGGVEDSGKSAVVTEVSATPPPFGLASFDGIASAGPGGDPLTGVGVAPDTQAGGHPYSITTNFTFNTATSENGALGDRAPIAPPKDTLVDLPVGFIGDPSAAARCRLVDLAHGQGQGARPLCSPESQIGVAWAHINGGANLIAEGTRIAGAGQNLYGPAPLYNMAPPPGMPAQFGFNISGQVVLIDARVRVQKGPDGRPVYSVSADSKDIPQGLDVNGATVTFWGTPADPSHTFERACPGWEAPFAIAGQPTCENYAQPEAFLRNPTSCTAAGEGLQWTAHVDSWFDPGRFEASGAPDVSDPAWKTTSFVTHEAPGYPFAEDEWGPVVGIEGCEEVPFTPSIEAQPTSKAAQGPSGLDVKLSVPQEGLTNPNGIAQADVRKVVVALPQGVMVNPSAAGGLEACSPAQIALLSLAGPTCPQGSKLGDVEVVSPLLPDPLKGAVYLASQNDNPFHSLIALYVVVKADGTLLKLPGRVNANPATGQLTTTFEGLPQLPFSTMHLTLKTGPRAPLANPTGCGAQAISYTLEGWNGTIVKPAGTYPVDCASGNGGFTPSFTAGTLSNAAGSFSPFVLSFATGEGEQNVKGLSFTMPPGVSAKLAGIPLCPNTSAAAGTCPEASRIGSVAVAAGAGPDPIALKGSVYLTGPYNGGPFGDAVVVPAVAGPFDLGNVVVRGSIRIDPHTAQSTVVSDPFPQFVNSTGIPSIIRRVDVNLDRPGFTFNPTSCRQMQVTGALTGAQGASANVASRFQAAECRSLAFKPKFSASTSSKVSRTDGVSLTVKVAYPKGAQANIRSVKVKLPKQLASRLPTLQQACPDATFAANPAACPAASIVGSAKAVTPVLATPLQGPAYFVSHGGAKFPELILVLQSEGVTIELNGETNIAEKTGITSSTFRSVPDAPVSSFELSLPRGPHSALGSKANLCKGKLVMPTTIVGQNGAVVKQATRIGVSGCAKHKVKRHAGKRHKRRK